MPATAQRRTSSLSLVALLLPVALSQVGCFANSALQAVTDQPVGTVSLVSATLGSHTLVPTACASGEQQLFLGADFLDTNQGLTMRLILEPTGPASVRIFRSSNPLDPGVLIQGHECDQLQLSLERTGWRINDIYDLRVSIALDCHAASGDSLQGKLAVDHCH